MAVEIALEDDLFFADLNRQISLLIDEEDDDDYTSYSSSIIHHHPPAFPSQYMYQESCRRELSKGTGVFIPQSSQPRRKHKQGKRSPSSYASKSNKNKQLLNSRATANNVVGQPNLPPNYTTNYSNMY
ncbi:Aspartate carbamoyltransferase [Bienertia sinuspersici]